MIEKGIFDFDGMKRFMNYVLLIQLSYLEFTTKNKEAKQEFDSFFSNKINLKNEDKDVE